MALLLLAGGGAVLLGLFLLARIGSILAVPAVIVGIVAFAYLLGGVFDGVNLVFGSKNATLGFSVDGAELAHIKATVEELNRNLFGDAAGGTSERLGRLTSLLRNADAVEGKIMEVKSILATFQNGSQAVDAFLETRARRLDDLVKSAVAHALELATKEQFWKQLTPRLAEAGLLKDLAPEVLLQIESAKAKIQEELRIKHKVAEKVEQIRTAGWRGLARGASEDFNEHLPFRALVFLGVCVGIFALRLGYQVMLRRIKIPPLIDETSYRRCCCAGRRPRLPNDEGDWTANIFRSGRPEIVLARDVQESVSDMAHVALWAAGHGPRRHVPKGGKRPPPPKALALPNAVFFGPPGTGKSLTARRLAAACGLDYAIMSGGNVLGLREEAVPELRRIFDWARRSQRGLVLFVDEAEAFLSQRGASGSPFVQAAVSFFLAQTTASSSRLLIILATNRARDLDEAVLSRMPFQIEFGRPDRLMVQKLVADRMTGLVAEARACLERVVTEGGVDLHGLRFTGRDVQSLFEEFERRWSLQCATEGREDVRRADAAWLARWLSHRGGVERAQEESQIPPGGVA